MIGGVNNWQVAINVSVVSGVDESGVYLPDCVAESSLTFGNINIFSKGLLFLVNSIYIYWYIISDTV